MYEQIILAYLSQLPTIADSPFSIFLAGPCGQRLA